MTVYIAGPIEGDAGYRRKFAAAVNMIRKAEPGASILNPGALPDGMRRADYMAICLQMVLCADIVVLLPGWRSSGGAGIEKRLADYLRIRTVEVSAETLQKAMEEIGKEGAR